MRALGGLLAFHAVLIVAGLGFLRGIGLTRAGTRAAIPATGPAFLAGIALVVLLAIVGLVIGVPLTLWTAAIIASVCAAIGFAVAWRRERPRSSETCEPHAFGRPDRFVAVRRLIGAAAAGYAAFGAVAMARLPTCCDDVQIWSLKGLTLFYYRGLRPEIFGNQTHGRAHPIYPLLQPVLEALLFRSMGRPELRLFHTELWLIAVAALWTLAYLVSRKPMSDLATIGWIAAAGLLVIAPAPLGNISTGLADTTGSVILAAGTVALGLWIERGNGGLLWLGSLLLAAAANTKDEDMVGAAAVLTACAVVLLVRREPGRLPRFSACAIVVLAAVLPWRLWVAAHHLTDAVTPRFPDAIDPGFLVGRLHQLHETVVSMIGNSLAGFGWIPGIFLAVAIVCLLSGTSRRIATFYVGAFAASAAALAWLYTTTPISLSYLLPTSMPRTVSVFMVFAAFGTAHMLAALAEARPLSIQR